jgi:hypothetical protein
LLLLSKGRSAKFPEHLRRGRAMAAESGKESTRDLVAKIGRATRLGERSRRVLDFWSIDLADYSCGFGKAM